jgi:hypothetical protein
MRSAFMPHRPRRARSHDVCGDGSITEREERPWLQRTLADRDPGAGRENIERMAALAERFPSLVLVPAHDARGFAEMPRLPARL